LGIDGIYLPTPFPTIQTIPESIIDEFKKKGEEVIEINRLRALRSSKSLVKSMLERGNPSFIPLRIAYFK
jgi:hypothetical protein